MCQVILMESCTAANAPAADHDHEHQLLISKDAAASDPTSAAHHADLPPSSSFSYANPSPDPSTTPPPRPNSHALADIHADDNVPHSPHINSDSPLLSSVDHNHPNLSLNLITPSHTDNNNIHPGSDVNDCTPGSPEFFLPANAYISLDDPSSHLMLTSYHTSPGSRSRSGSGSDPIYVSWPPSNTNVSSSNAAVLNCPSMFSSAGNSSDEGSISPCHQISHVDVCSQIFHDTSTYDASTGSYTSLLQSHHPAASSLFCGNNMQQSNFNGYSQMMHGSPVNYSYYHNGSIPFPSTYTSAPARVAPAAIFPPNTRAGMLEQCLNEAAQHEQEEQSWYTFLQPNIQEDHHAEAVPDLLAEKDAIRTRMGGSTSMNLMPVGCQSHTHIVQAAGARVAHRVPGMPMVDLHCQTMEDPNALRSPTLCQTMMRPMQLQRAQEGPQTDASTVSCCTSMSNKRRSPDGEDAWPSAEANACSPPLKMKRSLSFMSPGSRSPPQVDGHPQLVQYNVSPNHSNTTPSPKPAASYNMSGSPSSSNNQPDQEPPARKPGKSTTRQSVCNDPQSVAARHRRERISERLKTLQQLVPNGAKVDLVTMLEKAISYVKSLQLQVKVLSTDEYWPTPLSDKYSLNNLAAVAKLAASTYN